MTTKTQTQKEANIKLLKFWVRIIVEKDTPCFYAYAPSLKGLHMGGDTEKEARENAREAAALYLKSLLKHGDPIPIDIVQPENKEEKTALKKQISSRVEEITVDL
jgi:predicted RNase H-like HicB family nuclease